MDETSPPPSHKQQLDRWLSTSVKRLRPRSRVLVVDDTKAIRTLLREMLTVEGYVVNESGNGEEALDLVAESPPDCVICDVMMPGIDGFEVCQRLKSNELTRLIPVIMITGHGDMKHKLKAIEAGADDFIIKPFNEVEVTARVRSLLRFKRLNDDLENASNVVFALAQAIEKKDNYTEGHGERVATIATELAKYIGLSERAQDAVRKGGVLHDVGKIGCPDSILNKPGPLTADEFQIIKLHPEHGWEICRHLKSLHHCLPCIRWHHEKLDGTGYPDKLGEDDLAPEVRIMSIADIYDALSSARSYKPAFPPEQCFKILLNEAERGWWDKELVNAFVSMMREKGWDRPNFVIPATHLDIMGDILKPGDTLE